MAHKHKRTNPNWHPDQRVVGDGSASPISCRRASHTYANPMRGSKMSSHRRVGSCRSCGPRTTLNPHPPLSSRGLAWVRSGSEFQLLSLHRACSVENSAANVAVAVLLACMRSRFLRSIETWEARVYAWGPRAATADWRFFVMAIVTAKPAARRRASKVPTVPLVAPALMTVDQAASYLSDEPHPIVQAAPGRSDSVSLCWRRTVARPVANKVPGRCRAGDKPRGGAVSMTSKRNTPRRVASAPRGTDKGQQQNTNRSQQRSTTTILTCFDDVCTGLVTLTASLAEIVRDRKTARLAMDAYRLACDAHQLAEDFALWESEVKAA